MGDMPEIQYRRFTMAPVIVIYLFINATIVCGISISAVALEQDHRYDDFY